jgi:hypothetical protein
MTEYIDWLHIFIEMVRNNSINYENITEEDKTRVILGLVHILRQNVNRNNWANLAFSLVNYNNVLNLDTQTKINMIEALINEYY